MRSWLTLLSSALLATAASHALLFRVDQFNDVTGPCRAAHESGGKPLTYILNEDNPALYVSIDPSYPMKSFSKKLRRVDHSKLFGGLAESRLIQDLVDSKGIMAVSNSTFDCVLHVETELPKGEKSDERYDALSLMVVELNFSTPSGAQMEINTFGHEGHRRRQVTKRAHYSDRLWAAANPNFLLSGQLSGFDSIDYRTKVDPQHLIRPETLHSTFDRPAFITVNLTGWTWNAHAYLVFTSYKYIKGGQGCQEQKEFDCSQTGGFLGPSYSGVGVGSSGDAHLCMSSALACDGLPNCGQEYLPNQDENCYKIHWSSVLLSLVSYILLAITLLLCLSCFARVLIQWSVRSSLAELRAMGNVHGGYAPGSVGNQQYSPAGSFRSSSRFFSLLGSTFSSSRWERPPPTYDEAMKHVNPDLVGRALPPADPPAYSSSPVEVSAPAVTAAAAVTAVSHAHTANVVHHSDARVGPRSSSWSSRGRRRGSMPVATAVTPPPEYDVKETNTHALLEEAAPPHSGGQGHAYHDLGHAHFASRHQQVVGLPRSVASPLAHSATSSSAATSSTSASSSACPDGRTRSATLSASTQAPSIPLRSSGGSSSSSGPAPISHRKSLPISAYKVASTSAASQNNAGAPESAATNVSAGANAATTTVVQAEICPRI